MKILILSCNTGQGHNSAGLAIKEALEKRGIKCEMKDTLSFSRRRYTTKLISGGYMVIAAKAPAVFGGIYKAGDLISSPKIKSPIYYANAMYAQRLVKYINDEKFDGIIMPHVFPSESLTRLRRKGKTNVKCYAVATDYTCTPFWEETEPDFFFIPHEDLREEFASRGIPPHKLIATGIPVAEKYNFHTEQSEARKKLGLPEDATIFLIMTGSMGFGDISRIASGILKYAPENSRVLILTGRSMNLKEKIDSDFSGDGRVITVPFTREVPLYMDACSVLLTKPGGLTSTEAAIKNVPFVHTAPIPGCETKNALFFSSHGLSIYAKKYNDIVKAAIDLASDEEARKKMIRAQKENMPKQASDKIVEFIIDNISNSKRLGVNSLIAD